MAKQKIRTVSSHQTAGIADRHRQHLERLQSLARTGEGQYVQSPIVGLSVEDAKLAVTAARAELSDYGISPTDDLTTRHERFRRLKWAVGVFV